MVTHKKSLNSSHFKDRILDLKVRITLHKFTDPIQIIALIIVHHRFICGFCMERFT